MAEAMPQNDVRLRLALTNTTPPRPSIGLCEDILFIVFDQFDASDPARRADCARCARVCSLWSEPALRTLWKSLNLSAFLPLYWILLPDTTSVLIKWRYSSDTEALGRFFQNGGFVGPQEQAKLGEYFRKLIRQAPFSDPAIWQRFLHYAAYVQDLDHWQGIDSEPPLLHALIKQNDGKTFLPHLRSLTWLESPNYDGILPLLVPPSLALLELRIHANTQPRQVEEAIYALASAAPSLSCLRIHSDNKSSLKPPISGFHHLQSLMIHDEMTCPDLTTLSPQCRQTLEDLRYPPEGFVAPEDTEDRLALPNLRSLELFGPPTNRMSEFIAYLRAAHVDSLNLGLRDQTGKPANSLPAHASLLRSVSSASFAPALCRLTLTVQTKSSLGNDDIASTSIVRGIHPLFSLRTLRVLIVAYNCDDATLGTDADMLAAATAWPHMENLSFDFLFSDMYEVGGFPSLHALPHFARHCPRLARLRIPLAILQTEPEEAAVSHHSGDTGERLPATSYRLRTLEVQVRQWEAGVKPETVARQIDELFPSIGTDDLRFRWPIRPRIPPRRYQGRWDLMVTAWKELRAARGGNVNDV